jgi:dinuclear metal center YbgI/SA1388 family protein
MTEAKQLTAAFDALLQPDRFKDYGPNGLQVQGRANVHKLVSGVTASKALIEAAIDLKADGILVHHGLFWRGQDGRVVGWMRERLKLLLAHDINVWAYHLPLDAHPTLGNNAQLGQILGFEITDWFGEQKLACLGQVGTQAFQNAQQLADHVAHTLGRHVICIDPVGREIRRLAWCSGGAQGYFEEAIAAGVDVFLTGEISEPQMHYAHEMGVAFLACGHHATERYGAQAVASHVAQSLGVAHQFIDIDNPA